ncbi:MAG: translocation/assembly module TamB domain-containing protein [Spirochaetes bacterium]|nr:translocation/assembly module TamB domain-containing protein [Spirochaetota bacterium]
MKRVVKLEIISAISVLVLGFLLVTGFAFFMIHQQFNLIKAQVIYLIEKELQLPVKIESISPLFFQGIKLKNVHIHSRDNKDILKIETIKVKLRLKDILLKKIKPQKSIYSLSFDDYTFYLNEDKNGHLNIDSLLKKVRTSPKGSNSTNFNIEDISLSGKIIYDSRKTRLKAIIFNEDTSIDLISKEIEFETTLLPQNMGQIPVNDISFKIEGKASFGKKTNVIDMEVYDLVYRNLDLDKEFNINCRLTDKQTIIKAYDDQDQLSSRGVFTPGQTRLKGRFKNLDLNHYHASGVFSLDKKRDTRFDIQLTLKDLRQKLKYSLTASGKDGQITLDQLKIERSPKHFVSATGWIKHENDFFLKLWFENFSYDRYNLFGKAVLFPSYNSKKGFKLLHFYINDYRIKELKGDLAYDNNRIILNTLYNSENFLLSGIFQQGRSKLDMKFNNTRLGDISGIIKSSKLPDELKQVRISGNINTELNQFNRITSLHSFLQVTLSDNDKIKKVFAHSDYQDRKGTFKIKIVDKENNDFNIDGRSWFRDDKVSFKAYWLDSGKKVNITGDLIERRSRFDLFISINDLASLQAFISKKGQIKIQGRIRKTFQSSMLTSLSSRFELYTHTKDPENFQIKGDFTLRGKSKNDRITFRLVTEDKNILIEDVVLKYKNIHLTGEGSYNKNNNNVLVDLDKLKIKGTASFEEISLNFIVNNLENIKLDRDLQFNLNGIFTYENNFRNKDLNTGNLNLYNIKASGFKIDEVYLTYNMQDNNINITRLNSELYGGKIRSDEVRFYKKGNFYYASTLLRVYNLNYNNYRLRGKLYAKMHFEDKIYAKIKVIKFFINDLKLKDLAQELHIDKDRVSISKLNGTGVKGDILLGKHQRQYDLKIFSDDQYLALIEGKISKHAINMHFNFKNLEIDFLEDISGFIKSADGTIRGDIKIKGKRSKPDVAGFIKGDDIELKGESIVKSIESLALDISAKEGRISINKLQGMIGKGQFRLYGTIDLDGLSLGDWNLFFETLDDRGIYIAKAEDDLMGNIKGKVKITGDLDDLDVAGQVVLEDFDFTWPLSSGSGSAATPVKNINLDVQLATGQNVNFFQNQNNINILVKEGGKFHIRGNMNAEHKVVGKMEADKGTIDYFGNEFNIIYASVGFADAYDENVPWISAKAETTVKDSNEEDITITMIVEGRAYNDLAPNLVSSPALTKKEIFFLLNDSVLYMAGKTDAKTEIIDKSEKDINEIMRIGFVQIFDATYRNQFIAPLQRRARRFLGVDILRIKSTLVQNLLAPRIVNMEEETYYDDKASPFAGTQITVGKYLTEDIILKYSVALKDSDTELNALYYEHQIGVEWNLLKSLRFEWKYMPPNFDYPEDAIPQQEYILKWKQKISF